MKKLILIVIFSFHILSLAQDRTLNLDEDSKIEFKADYCAGFDGFKNYYFVRNNVLIKYFEGQTKEYQNLSLGKLTKVDITNPLKILLFYENFNTVQLLDNQLNEIQKVDFNQIENPILVKCAGISGQNKIWTWDINSLQIGLYDLNTNTYKTLGNPLTNSIVCYYTDFNNFYWIDSKNNWYTTTIYGNTSFLGMAETTDSFLVTSNDNILYSDGMHLFVKNRISQNIITIEIMEKSFKNFYYKDQILAIFTEKGITNYKILIP
jgi:hypothetical protein